MAMSQQEMDGLNDDIFNDENIGSDALPLFQNDSHAEENGYENQNETGDNDAETTLTQRWAAMDTRSKKKLARINSLLETFFQLQLDMGDLNIRLGHLFNPTVVRRHFDFGKITERMVKSSPMPENEIEKYKSLLKLRDDDDDDDDGKSNVQDVSSDSVSFNV